MKARFWSKGEGNSLYCGLCPHNCLIQEGNRGVCGVRENRNGEMVLPFYGMISASGVDPIEKKPLYHFYPTRKIFSLGFWGCNFHCPFCQNYEISQQTLVRGERFTPRRAVEEALKQESFALAYTYSEPLVHFEFIRDTAEMAREKGLKNVLVSNGFINPGPAAELIPLLDGANIDLKSLNPEFYKKELGGDLDAVKNFIKMAAGKMTLEVTTLVIPGKNDSPEEIRGIGEFLKGVDENIPLHLSCYYPVYNYTIPPTRVERLYTLLKEAEKFLPYVYPGNVGLKESNTLCPGCGHLLIRRLGYHTRVEGMAEGRCDNCGRSIPVKGV